MAGTESKLTRSQRSEIRRRAYRAARRVTEALPSLLDDDLYRLSMRLGAAAALDDDEIRRAIAERLAKMAEELL